MELNLNKMTSIRPPVMTKKIPYYPTLITDKQERRKFGLVNYSESFDGNHLPDDRDWEGTDLQTRMSYFLRWRKQELCQGTVSYYFFKYLVGIDLECFSNLISSKSPFNTSFMVVTFLLFRASSTVNKHNEQLNSMTLLSQTLISCSCSLSA